MVKKATKKKVAKKPVSKKTVKKVQPVKVESVVEAEPTPVVRKDAGYYSSRRKLRGWQ